MQARLGYPPALHLEIGSCSPVQQCPRFVSALAVPFFFPCADPFFPEAGGSIGDATDPMAAAPAGYVDAGSPPPVAYSMPEPAAYDIGTAGGAGGEDQFSGGGGGDGEQLGDGGVDDQFSGMPLQVGCQAQANSDGSSLDVPVSITIHLQHGFSRFSEGRKMSRSVFDCPLSVSP